MQQQQQNEESCLERRKNGKNPHMADMKVDVMYHIGLSSGTQDLKEMFGDIKVGFFKKRFQMNK